MKTYSLLLSIKRLTARAERAFECRVRPAGTVARQGFLLLLLFFAPMLKIQAQTVETPSGDKVITNAKLFGVGYTQVLDTYLSPEKYRGTDLRFLSHTTREREGSRLSRQLVHQGNISYVHNRAKSGNEIAGMYNFGYALHYNFALCGGQFNLKVGGMADINLGFIYNTHNSNNPAQARVFLHLAPSAATTYSFRLLGRPFSLRYEASVPLVGLMFSPNYGQSYYEIFSEGNYDHNLVPTTFLSAPSLRQMLTLDFPLLRSTIRIGYMGDVQQSHVNRLKTHVYTHGLVIGVVKRFKLIKIAP